MSPRNTIVCADALSFLQSLPDEYVQCIITSPPYFGLRDYGVDGQIGLEATPEAYVTALVGIFREARRVLRDDGTLWLNLGDSYAGGGGYAPDAPSNRNGGSLSSRSAGLAGARTTSQIRNIGIPPKNLLGIPWRVALALQADGWILRSDIIWHKPNPMPESVKDRPTKAHEYVFMFAKSQRYFYDGDAINPPSKHEGEVVSLGDKSLSRGQATGMGVAPSGNALRDTVTVSSKRNKRSVWTIATKSFKEAHFATFPPDLIKPMVLAGCPLGGLVMDVFGGAGTTGVVAKENGRDYLLSELNPEYVQMAERRIAKVVYQPTLL